jgi:uncharacterized Zn finger protein (UPF0148 family)
MYSKCKECESTLWSMCSQGKGICPDCEDLDHENKDLEDQLEELYQ